MTKTDTSPPGAEVEESQSELLFQALERFIDNMETSNRTLEWIEEQAREGNALRGLTEEALPPGVRGFLNPGEPSGERSTIAQ